MKKNTAFLIIFLLMTIMFSFPISAQEEEDSRILKWKKIEGAASYIVEIKKGERDVLKTESKENFIYLDLPPGEYQFNISVYNKFSKKVAETGWKKITIETAKQPVIKKYTPDYLYLNGDEALLYIDAYNIKERSVFSLVSDSGEIASGKVEAVNGTVFKVRFDSALLNPGLYSVNIVNPSGLKDTALAKFEIRDQQTPSISKINEKEFLNRGIYSGIIIQGDNFEENVRIEFRSDSDTIKPVSTEFISDSEISVFLDLSEAKPGKYRIYAENPSGLSEFSKRSIVIFERTDEKELMMKGYRKDKLTIHSGYEYGYFLENVSDYHNYNYAGITVRMQFDFNNDFFNQYIWLFPLGAEISFAHYPKDIYFNEFGFSIYYKSRFQSPVNFIVKGGGGFSIFEKMDDGGPEYGRYLSATGGLSVKLAKHLYLEATAGPKTWNVEGDYLNYIVSSVSVGFTY